MPVDAVVGVDVARIAAAIDTEINHLAFLLFLPLAVVAGRAMHTPSRG